MVGPPPPPSPSHIKGGRGKESRTFEKLSQKVKILLREMGIDVEIGELPLFFTLQFNQHLLCLWEK